MTASALADIRVRAAGGAAVPPRKHGLMDARSVVVEVFGPAGAGKTTFAQALDDALRAADCRSTIFSSARPAEGRGPAGGSDLQAAVQRMLLAPMSRAAKLFDAVAELGSESPVASQILALFPSRSPASALRFRRYLARLEQAVAARREAGSALIIDQGYLSALCSLAARSRLAHSPTLGATLARALDIVPPADVVIWIQTPGAVVEARLRQRLAAQSFAERLFEPGFPTLLEQTRLAETVRDLVRARRCTMLQAEGLGSQGWDEDVLHAAEVVRDLASGKAQR